MTPQITLHSLESLRAIHLERCRDANGAVIVDSSPLDYVLALLVGKWKLKIIFWLWKREVMRYGELKSALTGITHKMLSSQLKELESSQLLIRTSYEQIPPKVEYRLSQKGQSLLPLLDALCQWAKLQEDFTRS